MKDMKGSMSNGGSGMGLKDNTQASPVKSVNTDSEKYDMGRLQVKKCGTRGYPSQAIQGSIYK